MTTDLPFWDSFLPSFRDAVNISESKYATWLSPLQTVINDDNKTLLLLAPNSFVLDYIKEHFLSQLHEHLHSQAGDAWQLKLEIGARPIVSGLNNSQNTEFNHNIYNNTKTSAKEKNNFAKLAHLNNSFTFVNFVEGKSNQLTRAAAIQVAGNPGKAYNPLFIYGGVGLGKTHIMHAIGNMILESKPHAAVLYLHSERFVADMVKALQRNSINDFKRFYRTLDALLIDDIQFFAGKERSQEEFFHTFNALFEDQQQIVLTCDRYPKELVGLEERLQSRFGWGLTVAIEPPELETRVAILMSKAEQSKIKLPDEVAFFIAKHIQSNVRELEGALKRVMANSHFTGQPITLNLPGSVVKDLLALQAKLVTIDEYPKNSC